MAWRLALFASLVSPSGRAALLTTTMTAFETKLLANTLSFVKRSKRDGTVSMSMDNLRQCVPTPSTTLDGAPRGTNAAYYYVQLFRDVCASDKAIARFTKEAAL